MTQTERAKSSITACRIMAENSQYQGYSKLNTLNNLTLDPKTV